MNDNDPRFHILLAMYRQAFDDGMKVGLAIAFCISGLIITGVGLVALLLREGWL